MQLKRNNLAKSHLQIFSVFSLTLHRAAMARPETTTLTKHPFTAHSITPTPLFQKVVHVMHLPLALTRDALDDIVDADDHLRRLGGGEEDLLLDAVALGDATLGHVPDGARQDVDARDAGVGVRERRAQLTHDLAAVEAASQLLHRTLCSTMWAGCDVRSK